MDSTTSRSDLNAIKSRLGSIAPSRLYSLPLSVQKLLSDDMPALIEEIEAGRKVVEAASHIHWSCTVRKSERLSDALLELLHNTLKELKGGEK